MGLWSKGVDRSLTDDPRVEDFNPDLVVESWGTKYININLFLEPYRKTCSKLDLSKSQVIRWPIYKWDRLSLRPEKRGHAFIVTDSVSKTYMYYNNHKEIFTAGDYSKNLLSGKQNVKSTFEQSLKRFKHTTPAVYDLTPSELKQIRKTLKPVNLLVNQYRSSDKQIMSEWLNM